MMGDAFDYATNVCGIPGDAFVKLFVASTACMRMENQEPAYILGRGGIELMVDVLRETTGNAPQVEPQVRLSRSEAYWIGWASAYYQWWSGRTYAEFFAANSFEDLSRMYAAQHEADISRFAEVADARVRARFPHTNLRRIRAAYGCSQAELASMSGVSLRSIQMYEQRRKDINKASAQTVYRLARTLGCTMESLIEH
ncbi:MAG: helix-turn-helix transcriptional regulator [Coriobacteriales bacterium]|nr:helix-turn-helix transcriptional regulator [Coriobacteriales bacterium]